MADSLSSDATFLMRFVVFPIAIIGFGWGALLAILSPQSIPAEWGGGVFAAGMLAGCFADTVLFLWAYSRLKHVEIDGNTIRVSDLGTTFSTTLDDVDSISGSLLLFPELIWVSFRGPTPFGRKIVFMGKLRLLAGWSEPPAVHELRDRLPSRNGD